MELEARGGSGAAQVKAGAVAEKTRQYQRFLERVLDYTHDFSEINDILLRYATLEARRRPLQEAHGDMASCVRQVAVQGVCRRREGAVVRIGQSAHRRRTRT